MKRVRSGYRNWTFLLFMLFGFVLTLNGFGAELFDHSQLPDQLPTVVSPSPLSQRQTNPAQPANQLQTAKITPAPAPKPAVAPVAKPHTQSPTESPQSGAAIAATPQPTPVIIPAPAPAPAIRIPPTPVQQQAAATRYGHFPYRQASSSELHPVQGVWLHREAAQAFEQMAADARQAGADLVAVSGFRDVGLQSELFDNQIARKGSIEQAARVSAPPGHSEHHTGYAIDIGDENNPSTDVEVTFEQTPAFRWLNQNAPRYGFEMSFPAGNFQGISYEPWHWRFVGSQAAANVFAVARSR